MGWRKKYILSLNLCNFLSGYVLCQNKLYIPTLVPTPNIFQLKIKLLQIVIVIHIAFWLHFCYL